MLVTKLEELKDIFAQMERALIAYSGGIDSTLVAKIAFDVLGDRAQGLAGLAHQPHAAVHMLARRRDQRPSQPPAASSAHFWSYA